MNVVQCTYEREGPRVGYRVIAWRAQCKRMVAVTDGQLARCWQHGRQMKGGTPVDASSVCTCNAEDETKCSRCGQCSRCHGLCDCEIHPGTRCADCEADEDHCTCEDGFNPTSRGGDE